jgi:hypothetical protein
MKIAAIRKNRANPRSIIEDIVDGVTLSRLMTG